MTSHDLVDTDQAAELLGVPAAIIRSWYARQRVTPVAYGRGVGRGGRVPLWRLEDLEPLAATYRPRARHAEDRRT